MELVRFEPFAGFGNLRSVINDLFDENHVRSSIKPGVSKWYPAVDVLESKDSYLIRAELPGIKREDIKVEVKDGALVLSGERKSEQPAEGVEYRHVERVAAKFWRSFSLSKTRNRMAAKPLQRRILRYACRRRKRPNRGRSK